jgi:hypothetical protein
VPNKDSPNKSVITNALVRLSNDMKEKLEDSAPIEYDPDTHRVYFLDPSLWVISNGY